MSVLCPAVIVESKENNSELVKAVKHLTDQEHRYIIAFDHSFDNVQVTTELKNLKRCVQGRENIQLLDVICFEYILLEFSEFMDWIYTSNDKLLKKRGKAVAAREKLVEHISMGDWNYKALQEIVEYDCQIQEHNIEQLVAHLLFDLTRNTGFAVSKGGIGPCWVTSCCGWTTRSQTDLCGLDGRRLSIKEKMLRIYEETSLKTQFERIGLEVEV